MSKRATEKCRRAKNDNGAAVELSKMTTMNAANVAKNGIENRCCQK